MLMHVFFKLPLNKIDSASLKGISKKKKKMSIEKIIMGMPVMQKL